MDFTVPVIAFEFYCPLHMVIQRYKPQQDRLVEFNSTRFNFFFFSGFFTFFLLVPLCPISWRFVSLSPFHRSAGQSVGASVDRLFGSSALGP